MIIKNILKDIRIVSSRNATDELDIQSIAYHSKKCIKNTLFVAIKGYQTDGHLYIQNAIENGATALIVEQFDDRFPIPQYCVENSRIALAQAACNFYGHPSKKMTLIGITATNGKTSTSMMLNRILQEAGVESGLLGTIVYQIKDKVVPALLTTPESLDLQSFFHEIVQSGVTHTIMEVSSLAIEQSRVYGTDFDVVAMNNISREHIDEHGSFEVYWSQKQRLITEAKKEAYVILNLDDSYIKTLVDKTQGMVITFGHNDTSGNLYCKDVDLSSGFGIYTLVVQKGFQGKNGYVPEGTYPVQLSVAGYHSIINSLSAIAMALSIGIPMDKILSGLRNFTGIERRFQLIYDQEYQIIDDHFANKGNIDVTLKTLSMMNYKNLHIVYAIRGNRGVTVNKENIEALIQWKNRLDFTDFIATKYTDIPTHHDTVTEEEEAIFHRKMKEAGIPYEFEGTLVSAIQKVLKRVKRGDLVLLAGCQGMDYGCQIALDEIYKQNPAQDKDELYKVMKGRVVGVLH